MRIEPGQLKAVAEHRRAPRVVLTLVLATAVTIFGSMFMVGPSGAATNSSKPKPLSDPNLIMGITNGVGGSDLIHIAIAQGYFKQYGLNATIDVIPTGTAQLAAVLGGSIQIAQSGPSTTLIPIQNGTAKVKFVGATIATVNYQIVISKAWSQAHGITQKQATNDPDKVIPKLSGAVLGGVAGPTGSIDTILSYILQQYHVNGTTRSYLGTTAGEDAGYSVGRIDGYLDSPGTAYQIVHQFGGVVVDISKLTKAPLVTASAPSFYTATDSFIADHPDTLTAFEKGLWNAWEYVQQASHKDAIEGYMESLFPGTPDTQLDFEYQSFAKHGMWISKQLFKNTVSQANISLRSTTPITATYSQSVDSRFQKTAIKALGIIPPNYGPA
jgi:ABC-type nitrate/sulfonate/bicarbonate transport system substrate-binding protein